MGGRSIEQKVSRAWGLRLNGKIGDIYSAGKLMVRYKVTYSVTKREPVPDKENPNRCHVFVKAKATLEDIVLLNRNKLESDEKSRIEQSLYYGREETRKWTLEKIEGKWLIVAIWMVKAPRAVLHVSGY